MDLDDPRWASLKGGYRLPYDPRPSLHKLEHGDSAEAWGELWNGLHHQGDVGEASYATVPHIVAINERAGTPDWNTFALAATIEEARHDERNPRLPDWLEPAYSDAWGRLVRLALRGLADAKEPNLVRAALAVVAMGKQQLSIGRMALLAEDERLEMLGGSGFR